MPKFYPNKDIVPNNKDLVLKEKEPLILTVPACLINKCFRYSALLELEVNIFTIKNKKRKKKN